jgi:hypothetical protein
VRGRCPARHARLLFTSRVDAAVMTMAEPLMPHPEQPDTAFDEHGADAVPEEHDEPAEANETLTSAGRAAGTDLEDAKTPD